MDHDEEKTGAQLAWFTNQPQPIQSNRSGIDPNALDPNGLRAGKDALTGVSAQGEKEKGPDSVVCITLNAHSKMPFLTFNCVVVCRCQTQTF